MGAQKGESFGADMRVQIDTLLYAAMLEVAFLAGLDLHASGYYSQEMAGTAGVVLDHGNPQI